MDEKLQKYLDEAKAKERRKKDELLISLGLTKDETVRIYSESYSDVYNKWDAETDKYYADVKVPITVTDEEYEEIKKYASNSTDEATDLDTKAENFLAILNAIFLIIGIITALVILYKGMNSTGSFKEHLIEAAVVAGGSLISWAIWKVVLNISYNLHEINSKLKR